MLFAQIMYILSGSNKNEIDLKHNISFLLCGLLLSFAPELNKMNVKKEGAMDRLVEIRDVNQAGPYD